MSISNIEKAKSRIIEIKELLLQGLANPDVCEKLSLGFSRQTLEKHILPLIRQDTELSKSIALAKKSIKRKPVTSKGDYYLSISEQCEKLYFEGSTPEEIIERLNLPIAKATFGKRVFPLFQDREGLKTVSRQRQAEALRNRPKVKKKIKARISKKTFKPCFLCQAVISSRKTYCEDCQPNLLLYRSRANFNFNVYKFPEEFDLTLINRHGWFSTNCYKSKNKTVNMNGVSRDHMYSVYQGFINKRDPLLLAHPANCSLMVHNGPHGNNSKNKDCTITWDQLLERIEAWNVKYSGLRGQALVGYTVS